MTEERKIRILCAEDEQDIRENMAEILRDEGFEVFEAENGKEGFKVFLKTNPDIVISDVMMPEVDGYGLLKLIRSSKNNRGNNVPFIFLSALGQKDNIMKGVGMSANDYLVKPVDFDLMIAKIKEKTLNAQRVSETHKQTISKIKDQVSVALPGVVSSYLDIITQTAAWLKNEPYGPVPHRGYAADFDKIYLNALKLRSALVNALDSTVIDHRLNADEEVLLLFNFLKEFVTSISEKYRNRIVIEKGSDSDLLIKIKVDRLVILESMKKILAGMFKADPDASINIRLMHDPLDQMVVIFYLNSKNKKLDLHKSIRENEIAKILDQQNCRFEVVETRENTAVLVIPSYRIIS